jgi:hypothetical protein
MEVKKLTLKDAIEQGYKYCTPHYQETRCIKIEECDFKRNYVLLDKEPRPFFISDELIPELVDSWLNEQDEVYDEDGRLNDAVAKVDFSEITAKVNEALSNSIKFWHETDIFLIQNTVNQ